MSDEPLQPSQEAIACGTDLMGGVAASPRVYQILARFEAKIRADQREIDAKVVENNRGTQRFQDAAAIRKEAP